jgi:hypothetical protein
VSDLLEQVLHRQGAHGANWNPQVLTNETATANAWQPGDQPARKEFKLSHPTHPLILSTTTNPRHPRNPFVYLLGQKVFLNTFTIVPTVSS